MRQINLSDCVPIPFDYIKRAEPQFSGWLTLDALSMPVLAYRHPELIGHTYFLARLKVAQSFIVYRYSHDDNCIYVVPDTEVYTRKHGLGMLIRSIRSQAV